jgi:putative transcription antitermination factor YqgF
MFNTIAIDWGSVRVGIAFGSTDTGLVIPYTKNCLNQNVFEVLSCEIANRKIDTLVIGIPTNFQLQPTATSSKILEFVEQLKTKFPNCQIHTINERFTTQKAQNQANSYGLKLMKDELNHQSACEIFNLFLNQNAKN